MEFKRHTINDVHSNRFYQLPKFLFDGEFKTALSAEAKLLYALLRDRHELSLQNGWVNGRNEVYLIFKREEMCDLVGCGMDKIRKLINELKNCGLLDEERQGQNMPNLIFLNYINIEKIDHKASNEADCGKTVVRTTEKSHSGLRKNRTPDCGKSVLLHISDTEKNNTDSINQSAKISVNKKQPSNESCDVIDMIDDTESYSEIVKENIALDIYQENPQYNEFFTSAYEIIMDTVSSSADTVRVGKENKPREVVKSRFLKLNSEHLEYVYDCLQKNKTKIINIRSWLVTALYNAPVTMDAFYTAAVGHDLYGKSV